jgi:uncharacterized zinc-type alcohol dehydrogenase-like protein
MPRVNGYAALEARGQLVPFVFDRRDVKPHDVAVDIAFCGICHSDIHQARDEWTGDAIFPMVPGHEIVGTVRTIGASVTKFTVGDTVGVGTFVDSCRTCDNCRAGLEQYCIPGNSQTYNGHEQDGKTPTRGGYSNAVVVDENYVLRMPPALPIHAAAPLLCAGITLYSPLRHWRVGPGSRVGVIGLGGLGNVGVKLARAMGADVSVFSHSPRKRDEALRLGATRYHVMPDMELFEQLKQSFDVILNTVSVPIDWNRYVELLRLDGTMVIVGIPASPVPMEAMPLIQARRCVAGSGTGGVAETQEMLDFCAAHHIISDVEVVRIQDVNDAWNRVVNNEVHGRLVIDMASLPAPGLDEAAVTDIGLGPGPAPGWWRRAQE